jgi:hypothetical protein
VLPHWLPAAAAAPAEAAAPAAIPAPQPPLSPQQQQQAAARACRAVQLIELLVRHQPEWLPACPAVFNALWQQWKLVSAQQVRMLHMGIARTEDVAYGHSTY